MTKSLQHIDELISQIQLVSYNLNGDLDTRFMFSKLFWLNHLKLKNPFVTPKRVIRLLTRTLTRNPEQLERFGYSGNIEHFVGTLQRNYQEDEDVRALLSVPVLQAAILDQIPRSR